MIDPIPSFEFGVPTRILFGCGSAKKLGESVRKFGFGSAFVVLDPGLKKGGFVEHVVASLDAVSIPYSIFTKVEQNPFDIDMEQGAHKFAANPRDAVIGIGGGSAMDTAKGIALLATNGGRIREYDGTDRVAKNSQPLICVPTTAGTGSEVTANIAVTNFETHEKMSVRSIHNYPRLALLDPELLVNLPASIAAASGMDALVHAVESYVSLRANPMTRMLAYEAVRRVGSALVRFVSNRRDIEQGAQMLFGSMLAGMVISYTGTGSAHAIARALGGKYNVVHGMACGILLEPVMRFNLPQVEERYAELGEPLGAANQGISTRARAEAAVRRVGELRAAVGLPSRLPIEVAREALSDLAEWASRSAGPNPRPTSPIDAQDLITQVVSVSTGD
jgi:alcohol dehydrogenase class IV